MESLKTMHIKRFVAHLLTFRHTVYYRIWFFCRPFRRTGREHHKTSDKPPPAGVGSRDGLLYVYHTADCSPLWCVVGCVVLYRTRRRPLVRCRSPPNVQDSQKFLNDLEDKTMRYVFLSHVLDNCPFDLIGVRLGLTYKGAAAVYYRAVQKLKKSIEGVEKHDI